MRANHEIILLRRAAVFVSLISVNVAFQLWENENFALSSAGADARVDEDSELNIIN